MDIKSEINQIKDILEELRLDILSLKKLDNQPTHKKSEDRCQSNTKNGKQCSKKQTKDQKYCSLHLKNNMKKTEKDKTTDNESDTGEDVIPEISMEEKKRHIELLFEGDIEN